MFMGVLGWVTGEGVVKLTLEPAQVYRSSVDPFRDSIRGYRAKVGDPKGE